ncbi:hypothetical protein G6F43_001828 [Rhizopus delemar]|nr:hypothetical protein G6F43_001828 [Rhizopus delemar]
MDPENVTNAEMENQFRERNSHLKNDMNSIVNSATSKTHDILQPIQQVEPMSTSSIHPAASITGSTNRRRSSMMHSAMEDIQAMHSRDPDRFGTIASKYDDSFGNAL